jgi:hypothetical protein
MILAPSKKAWATPTPPSARTQPLNAPWGRALVPVTSTSEHFTVGPWPAQRVSRHSHGCQGGPAADPRRSWRPRTASERTRRAELRTKRREIPALCSVLGQERATVPADQAGEAVGPTATAISGPRPPTDAVPSDGRRPVLSVETKRFVPPVLPALKKLSQLGVSEPQTVDGGHTFRRVLDVGHAIQVAPAGMWVSRWTTPEQAFSSTATATKATKGWRDGRNGGLLSLLSHIGLGKRNARERPRHAPAALTQ